MLETERSALTGMTYINRNLRPPVESLVNKIVQQNSNLIIDYDDKFYYLDFLEIRSDNYYIRVRLERGKNGYHKGCIRRASLNVGSDRIELNDIEKEVIWEQAKKVALRNKDTKEKEARKRADAYIRSL